MHTGRIGPGSSDVPMKRTELGLQPFRQIQCIPPHVTATVGQSRSKHRRNVSHHRLTACSAGNCAERHGHDDSAMKQGAALPQHPAAASGPGCPPNLGQLQVQLTPQYPGPSMQSPQFLVLPTPPSQFPVPSTPFSICRPFNAHTENLPASLTLLLCCDVLPGQRVFCTRCYAILPGVIAAFEIVGFGVI